MAASWVQLQTQAGQDGLSGPASSTFAPGEHLKEMDSIAQGLWWGFKGMLQTVKEKAFFSPMIIFSCARADTCGSLMGLDLFWGYSELYVQGGFLFEAEGVEPNKNAAGKTPCCFQLL